MNRLWQLLYKKLVLEVLVQAKQTAAALSDQQTKSIDHFNSYVFLKLFDFNTPHENLDHFKQNVIEKIAQLERTALLNIENNTKNIKIVVSKFNSNLRKR